MTLESQAAPERPVHQRVLAQGDHDVVSLEPSNHSQVCHAAVQRTFLVIGTALQKSDFYDACICRAVHAASPYYLAKHGTPQQPRDLLAHNCLLLSGFARLAQWPMFEFSKRILLPVKGNVTCDSADVLLDMALAGIGIARFGDFLAERAIADGRLVPLLTHCHDPDPTPISALVLPGRQNIPRVRALLDFLKEACRVN